MVRSLRRQVSLLMAEGHGQARFYPVGMVWEEASFVVERRNNDLASQAIALQAAGASIMDKKGAKHFKELIKGLTSG